MDTAKLRHMLLCCVSAAALTPAAAAAQEQGEQAAVMEELIVTIDRRAQSLQSFAGTAQAFTGQELTTLGVADDFRNLQHVVPGLHIFNQEGQVGVFIRGVGTTNNDFSSDPGTAVHLNNVYLPRPRGIGPLFFDLQRLEVNKGPQGTLRGRNATAGTINVITARPDYDAIEGYVQLGAGNFGSRNFEGAVNVPITDTLAVRGAVTYAEHDEYYTNALDNGVPGAGAEESFAYRISALWEPTDRLSIFVMFDEADIDSNGFPGNFFGTAIAAGFDIGDLPDARNQVFQTEGDLENDILGISGTISYDFDAVIVQYDGGYRQYDFDNINARRPFQQGAVFPGVDLGQFDSDNFGTFYQSEDSEWQVHELRVFSPDSARLRWTVGGFYFKEDFDNLSFDISDRSFFQNSLGGENRINDGNVESVSGFADATYDVTDRLRIKGGVRFTSDRETQVAYGVTYDFSGLQNLVPGLTADDVRFGTPGFQIADVEGRAFTDPLAAGIDPITFFLDGVQTFGARDTLGGLLTANAAGLLALEAAGTIDPILSSDGIDSSTNNQTYVDWRAGVEYDITDRNMVYATVSTGTRGGGINPDFTFEDGSQSDSVVDPEDLLVVEVGSKNDFTVADVPVRLNGSFFYYDYQDIVVQSLIAAQGASPDSNQFFLTNANAADAAILGIEIEGDVVLPFGFQVSGNLTWLDAEFGDGVTLPDTRQLGGENILVDLGGFDLPFVSTWNITANVSQTIDFDWGWVDWNVNLLYRSDYAISQFDGVGFDADGNQIPLADVTNLPTGVPADTGSGVPGIFLNDQVPDVFILNVSGGANFGEDGRFRIEGFVQNATNETYSERGFLNPFVNIRFLNNPRTMGARFRANF